jgi:hypothetical protein
MSADAKIAKRGNAGYMSQFESKQTLDIQRAVSRVYHMQEKSQYIYIYISPLFISGTARAHVPTIHLS